MKRTQQLIRWDAAIPPLFRTANLADFSEEIQATVKGSGSCLLTGPVGTGKTRLLVAILRMALEADESIAYRKAATLNNQMDATYSDDDAGSEWGIINELTRVRWLGLDDLGAEKWSEKRQERLLSILDARIEWQRPFILTSNLPMAALATHLGERLYDRVRGSCRVVKLGGKSRRKPVP